MTLKYEVPGKKGMETYTSNLGKIKEQAAIIVEEKKNPYPVGNLNSKFRAFILTWLLRVQERCRISDAAWFKAVKMFDRVFEEISKGNCPDMNPFFIAATSIYMTSKFLDDKYLYASMFSSGVNMTKCHEYKVGELNA